MDLGFYASLAELLSYPEAQPVSVWPSEQSEKSAVALQLSYFRQKVRELSLHQLQELFIRTFDLSPVCSLEMGWHLFGENYDRGLLLVKMRQQLRQHGIPETSELPDHLTNALRLLPCMTRDDGSYFAGAVVLPALEKMLQAIHRQNNPYEHVLEAARLAVHADFPNLPAELAIPAGVPELRVLA
jgi:nitrate reductase delta subunit